MREVQIAEHVVHVDIEDAQENEELRQQFTRKRYDDVVVGHREPLFRSIELQFGSERIGRNEEHEQHQNAGDEHRGKIEIVACPRIAYHVQVDADGLQEGGNLLIGKTFGSHSGLPNGSRTQRGYCLQVAVKQRARCERSLAVVERNLGLTGREHSVGGSFRNVEESVDLVFLNGVAGLVDVGIVGNHVARLERVEFADKRTRC